MHQRLSAFIHTVPPCKQWKSSYHLLSTGNMQLIPKYVMYYTVNNISINLISHLYPSPNYKKNGADRPFFLYSPLVLYSSSVNKRADNGATPVYFAAQEGRLDCLQFLVTQVNPFDCIHILLRCESRKFTVSSESLCLSRTLQLSFTLRH